jgi:hypothetical protein
MTEAVSIFMAMKKVTGRYFFNGLETENNNPDRIVREQTTINNNSTNRATWKPIPPAGKSQFVAFINAGWHHRIDSTVFY